MYYDYATSSNDVPVAGVDANYYDAGYVKGSPYYTTEVGEYDNESPYGTYDQNGNVWEWNETLIGSSRGLRGGAWGNGASYLTASYRFSYNPTVKHGDSGIRVASSFTGDDMESIPEPVSIGLVLLSVSGLILRRVRQV